METTTICLREYQQDVESGHPGDFNQELKDCVWDLRRESPRESLSSVASS